MQSKCSPLDLWSSDHLIQLSCLKHWNTTSVLTVSLLQNIRCVYRNKSSPCRRLHLLWCSFSHYIFFSMVAYLSISENPTPNCASLQGLLTPSCLDSLHDCLFRYKQCRVKTRTHQFRNLGSVSRWHYHLQLGHAFQNTRLSLSRVGGLVRHLELLPLLWLPFGREHCTERAKSIGKHRLVL